MQINKWSASSSGIRTKAGEMLQSKSKLIWLNYIDGNNNNNSRIRNKSHRLLMYMNLPGHGASLNESNRMLEQPRNRHFRHENQSKRFYGRKLILRFRYSSNSIIFCQKRNGYSPFDRRRRSRPATGSMYAYTLHDDAYRLASIMHRRYGDSGHSVREWGRASRSSQVLIFITQNNRKIIINSSLVLS